MFGFDAESGTSIRMLSGLRSSLSVRGSASANNSASHLYELYDIRGEENLELEAFALPHLSPTGRATFDQAGIDR
jgi:hypothetical protein